MNRIIIIPTYAILCSEKSEIKDSSHQGYYLNSLEHIQGIK